MMWTRMNRILELKQSRLVVAGAGSQKHSRMLGRTVCRRLGIVRATHAGAVAVLVVGGPWAQFGPPGQTRQKESATVEGRTLIEKRNNGHRWGVNNNYSSEVRLNNSNPHRRTLLQARTLGRCKTVRPPHSILGFLSPCSFLSFLSSPPLPTYYSTPHSSTPVLRILLIPSWTLHSIIAASTTGFTTKRRANRLCRTIGTERPLSLKPTLRGRPSSMHIVSSCTLRSLWEPPETSESLRLAPKPHESLR